MDVTLERSTCELYRTIYADPPWMERGGGKIKRGADRHYALMKTTEIASFLHDTGLESFIAPNAHLYLWVTNNFLTDGFRVMDAWGFSFKTVITWCKEGNIGLGQYFRGRTEHCLFGVRGMLPYKVKDGKLQQGVTGFTAPRGKHSEKPLFMRRMVEKVSYPPYLELFARQRFEGWDCYGTKEWCEMRCVDDCEFCAGIDWSGRSPAVECTCSGCEGRSIDPFAYCYFGKKRSVEEVRPVDPRQSSLFDSQGALF